ncbi:MAG TPA: hypothetical protein VG387_17875 [Rhizomicrobium sp.]|jgi:uncharacterized membrane protein|nr:hypothetical protein [Rhizomicrobium sp.]
MSPDAATLTGAREDGLRATVLIAYGLFLLALCNGVTAIAGVILLYVKRADARGTPWDSHFRNLITVFWVGLALTAIVIALALPVLGALFFALVHTNGNPPVEAFTGLFVLGPVAWLAAVVFFVWYLIRTISGFLRALEGRPY